MLGPCPSYSQWLLQHGPPCTDAHRHTQVWALKYVLGEPSPSQVACRAGFPVYIPLGLRSPIPAGEAGRASQLCPSSPPTPRASRKSERKGGLGGNALARVCLQPLGSSHQQSEQWVRCSQISSLEQVHRNRSPMPSCFCPNSSLPPWPPHYAMAFSTSLSSMPRAGVRANQGPVLSSE